MLSIPTANPFPEICPRSSPPITPSQAHQAFRLNNTGNVVSMLYTLHVVGQTAELRYPRVCDYIVFLLTIAVDILLGNG